MAVQTLVITPKWQHRFASFNLYKFKFQSARMTENTCMDMQGFVQIYESIT